jgi:hypothetical protein
MSTVTGQLALPMPMPKQRAKRQAKPDEFGLIVNEVMLNSLGSDARAWWFEHSMRFEARGAARILAICIAGALVEIGPFPKDDVEFMRDHMIEHGVHPNVLKIRSWIAELPECTYAGPCKRCGSSHRIVGGGPR